MTKDEIRELAESSLLAFIRLVAPHRVLGTVHEEVIGWWTRQGANSHQLLLLPRGHQKSELVAYRVAWEITKNPAVTVLYISSTSGLAEKQLKRIKDILTSPVYTRYWPNMVEEQEGRRELWNANSISVDHPTRKAEGVRDATVFTGGLTTSLTGFHCDIAVLDDVVVQENAYSNEGRNKVKTQYSLLSSIENPEAQEWVVGTRYDPKDLYQDLLDMREEVYNEDGDLVDSRPVFEVFERVVEDLGDGTGQFLWPRQVRSDGKWFGFNTAILMKKKAQYLDKAQFFAQYYNNPNDPTGSNIKRDKFTYYDRKHIARETDGYWYFRDRRLNVFAAIDFAFSTKTRADFSAIVVAGIDFMGNIFVLDIDRFKTDRISEYYKSIERLFLKWEFRKLRAEVTVAQKVIVTELKNQYLKPNGLAIKIEEYNPPKGFAKEERIRIVLEPKYETGQIWHYEGGNCQILEDELILERPQHDDVKDALASVVEICVPPKRNVRKSPKNKGNVIFHSRFGGVAA